MWSHAHVYRHFEIDGKTKLLIKLYDRRDDLSFRIVKFPLIWCNIPSAPVSSLHNSYITPKLSLTTHTVTIALNLLQLDFWNRVMLLKDWHHHYISFMVVIMNSWIVTMYPIAPWKLLFYSTCHIFHFLFILPWIWLSMINSADVSRGRLPYLCS